MDIYSNFKPKDINDFTTNNLSGNGIFDRMMNSVELHIQDEYKKNRITGANYATVYLGALQSVLQCATQFVTVVDNSWLELEKLKLERDKLAIEIELQKAQLETEKMRLEIAKAQLEQEKAKIPLIEAETLEKQAMTKDIIPNGENQYEGERFNIHGIRGQELRASIATVENAEKASALQLAEKLSVTPFATIESAEGVGASYYGLNGGNTIDYINKLRETFGLTKLDTKKYSGEHEKYRNCWSPGVSLGEDDS